jgi:hypothetical protein
MCQLASLSSLRSVARGGSEEDLPQRARRNFNAERDAEKKTDNVLMWQFEDLKIAQSGSKEDLTTEGTEYTEIFTAKNAEETWNAMNAEGEIREIMC